MRPSLSTFCDEVEMMCFTSVSERIFILETVKRASQNVNCPHHAHLNKPGTVYAKITKFIKTHDADKRYQRNC
jgi:hypothetical protein